MKRSSGILLHPTSLPGPYGIGDLGDAAYAFIDWLADAGQGLWQVLPLGPTGYGDSPYAAFSTFAGNPLLVSPDALERQGYLERSDFSGYPRLPESRVDYGAVIPAKNALLKKAAARFLSARGGAALDDFQAFKKAEAWWLDDFALFMDIKESYDAKAQAAGREGAMWSNYWPRELALRDAGALEAWTADPERAAAIEERKAIQFFFFRQWDALKAYANSKGIAVVGDLPIFVAPDSVDVWARRDLFRLDGEGRQTAMAGVPPDYFSETGQLWGNPLYAWDNHREGGFDWWIRRVHGNLRLFDWLRIDHFRGFEGAWSVPAGETTAVKGEWVRSPGKEFFAALRAELGELPILAEDLGFITDEVRSLRDSFGLPGMKILQFAFDAKEGGKGLDSSNGFLPHMYSPLSVVYTGTHDNDTLAGWISKASKDERRFVREYCACGGGRKELVAAMIRLAFASVAAFAVIPLQDVLALGSEARMNVPSTVGGNWAWRARKDQFRAADAQRLSALAATYARSASPAARTQKA